MATKEIKRNERKPKNLELKTLGWIVIPLIPISLSEYPIWTLLISFLKGVLAKNERGYRRNAKNKRF